MLYGIQTCGQVHCPSEYKNEVLQTHTKVPKELTGKYENNLGGVCENYLIFSINMQRINSRKCRRMMKEFSRVMNTI
jgi:hypothetical protein